MMLRAIALWQISFELKARDSNSITYLCFSFHRRNGEQKSANYTCVSSNSVGQVSKSVYVYVVDRGTIELCPNSSAFGVNWPSSSPGSPILAECPKRYEGQSQRICEQRDFGKPMWLTPNFANCVADSMVDVYNEVSTFIYSIRNDTQLE